MNSHQLHLFIAVVDAGYSVTRASQALYTSQPGVSKQLGQLEEELKSPLFRRKGKHLLGLTMFGETALVQARSALARIENIRTLALESQDPGAGTLSIATTHTQARYALPEVIRKFRTEYPRVALSIHQGTPSQIAAMTAQGEVDFAIATEGFEVFKELILLPWYRWNRCVVAASGHPLLRKKPLTLKALGRYPLVTYTFGFTGRTQLDAAFGKEGVIPNVVLTAVDADVIKTYVKLGIGVGIIARMAFNSKRDRGLSAMDAGHLFEESVTRVGFRSDIHMAGFKYAFLRLMAPHFSRKTVDKALSLPTAEVSGLFRTSEFTLR